MIKRVAGFVIFRCLSGQIEYLLLRAAYGNFHWSAPKGYVAHDEDDFTAALRETKEETGYDETDLKIYIDKFVLLNYQGKNYPNTVTYWLAELRDPYKPTVLSVEHTDIKWLSKDAVNEIVDYYFNQDLFDKFHCMIIKMKQVNNKIY